jgi:hypothetical protein
VICWFFAHLLITYAEVARQNPGRADQMKELLETPKLFDRALEEAYLAAHLGEAQAALGNDDPYIKSGIERQNAQRSGCLFDE